MEPENREPEMKVTDRRRFSAEGEPLEGVEENASTAEPLQEIPERGPLPPATFEFLILSLRYQAEIQLGLYEGDEEGGRGPDLEGACNTIDLLGVLQQKTRGNLSLEEQRLLDNSLTELRFRYVQAVEKAGNKS